MCINIICYADDRVFIAESEDNLQWLLRIFNLTIKTNNMIAFPPNVQCIEINVAIEKTLNKMKYTWSLFCLLILI